MPTEPRRGPLRGVGVVVTRDEDDDGRLTAALEARGAVVLHWPTVEAAAPEDPAPLRAAASSLHAYDWLVLTSRRAVAALAPWLETRPGPGGPRVAVVGRSTEAAARSAGWAVELVAEPATGEALVTALGGAGVGMGTRVLFPASEIARSTVPEGLRSLGAEVDRVTSYRMLPAPLDREECAGALAAGRVQVVSVTSPSAVRGLREGLGPGLWSRLVEGAVLAAIGPTTGAAARDAGAPRVIEAADHTFEGLAERIVEWCSGAGERGAR